MRSATKHYLGGALLVGAFCWAYWPTLLSLEETWNSEPDYSHGFLVAPIALYFLWVRRDRFPASLTGGVGIGLLLIGFSVALRVVASLFYIDSLDGWSIPIWIAGACWLLGGWPLLRWSLPSVAFLWFMVPLPYRAEHLLSLPLQRVATKASCWLLQSLGQPALAEGNTILMGELHLEVEEACSGLRMFLAFFALCTAYVVIANRPRWQKGLVFASVVPIAITSNVLRVTGTGLLYRYIGGDAARTFTHDAAGWAMMPLAAAMLALLLWYLNRLFIEVRTIESQVLLRRRRSASTT